jgi:hypothetical protein
MKKLFLVILALAGLGLAPVAVAAPSPVTNPFTPCRSDGYLSVVTVKGQPFKNAGECIAYVVRGGKLGSVANAAVSGPFVGSVAPLEPPCGFLHQTWDLAYAADAGGVGALTMDTCVNAGTPFFVTGTFSLTTPAGTTLGGTLLGTGDAGSADIALDLVLSPSSGGSITLVGVLVGAPGPIGTGTAHGTLTGTL